MSNGALSPDKSSGAAVARSCHVIQWQGFVGYGFNLQPGHFIGKVDENSPAEAAGLKQGDRIIEVNGVNIANENHKQVVQRIKTVPNETKLLVVDPEADKYFKSNNIVVKTNLPNVVHLKTPPKEDMDKRNIEEVDSNKSVIDENKSSSEKLSTKSNSTTPSSDRKQGFADSPEPHLDSADEAIPSLATTRREPVAPTNGTNGTNQSLDRNQVNDDLNLNMTAKELRAKLASRKKYDPKKDSMDFKKKYDIVQKL